MPSPSHRVVVTGLGALTPIGRNVPEYWDAMMKGTSGARRITYFDPERLRSHIACELKDFDPTDYLDKKEARRMDPYTQYALVASGEALRDAGIDTEAMDDRARERAGVVMGSGIGGIMTLTDQFVVFHESGPRRLSPFLVPMMIPDIAAGQVSIQYGLRGPNHAVTSACATGNNAIVDAALLIERGLADVMVAGGSEAGVVEITMGGFDNMRALSTRNDEPEKASRPFDADRDGFVLGEGAGAIVLESLEHAQARGARVYAEVVGYGMSADAYHVSAPHPEGRGAAAAMRMALETSGLEPEDVDYLNMHGTSTPLGDIAETEAIKKVFGDHAYEMSLSSTKSMTGHLLGAAGAIEGIASILAIVNDRIPPTINFETPDPRCDLDYTFNEPRDREVTVALSNAFGFGGHNTCVVFKKMEA